ncbi:MAG: DNA polymerase III subunit chi [Rhodanobacteraceae bacterium]
MRADFYLIDKPRFRENPLLLVCELAGRAFASEQPTLILARSSGQADALDELLWTFDDNAWIPHQLAGDDEDALAPVLIASPACVTASRPLVVNLRDACVAGDVERVLEVVGVDAIEREASRQRWREYRRRGWTMKKNDM